MRAGTLEIELLTNVARLQKEMKEMQRAVRGFSSSAANDVDAVATKFDKLGTGMGGATRSAGQMRLGMQQLSFQIGDVATSLAGGAKPMQVFAQQSGQVVQALGLMTNGSKGLLGFLGGPWGAIITAAGVLLAPFILNLIDTGTAAGKTKEEIEELVKAVAKLNALNVSPRTAVSTELTKLEYQLAGLEAQRGRPGTRGDALDRMKEITAVKGQITALKEQLEIRDKLDAQQARIDARYPKSTRLKKEDTSALREAAREYEKLISMMGDVRGDIMSMARDPLKGAGIKVDDDPLAKFHASQKQLDDEWDFAQRMEDLRNQEAQDRRDRDLETARQIGILLGRSLSGPLMELMQIVQGFETGNFGSGKVGSVLNLLNQAKDDKGKGLVDRFGSVLQEKFGKDGVFADTMKGLAGGAGIGLGVAQLMGGGTAKSIGGAIGGAAGKAIGTAIGGPLGGAVGSVLGSIGGSLIGGAFAKTKKGSSTLGFTNGELGVTSTVGNSNSRKQASIALGGGVSDQLSQIAELLGGDLNGAISTSIGMRKKKYTVDTTGAGRTKGAGVLKFADEASAVRAAIEDALADGVITGISAAAKRILASGKDLQKAIEQAADIESIPRRLKAFENPIGAAIDDLNDKWAKTIRTLNEAGASSEQWAQAQKLYQYELSDVKKQTDIASTTLKDFLDSLGFGSSSPLSLRDQEMNAYKELKPFLDDITAGKAIDQDAYTKTAQTYLDIERQLGGSTSQFFDKFNMIRDYTNQAISNSGATAANVQPIVTEDPFSKATADATRRGAEAAEATAQMIPGLPDAIASALSRYFTQGQVAASGFITADRGFLERRPRK
jgi:hypothetical protein